MDNAGTRAVAKGKGDDLPVPVLPPGLPLRKAPGVVRRASGQ